MEHTILIEKGRIYVEGKETVDPVLIGYAVLDAIENGYDFNLSKSGYEIFNNKEIVYLVHDVEQLPRMIVSTVIDEAGVTYELISGTQISKHFSYELSKTKMVF